LPKPRVLLADDHGLLLEAFTRLLVLQLLAEGRSMKEIGARLDITTRTVAFHKYRLMAKFSLHSTAELVQLAIRRRII
jgi:DNA-binding CsgD family transcriptional regulator